jgi:RNA polymerase sigma-70 factor (ECF subfamily)
MALSAEIEVENGRNQIEADLPRVRAARQGDTAAWEVLVRQYQQPAFRLAYLILANAEDAEEVAQDAFIRAFASLDGFDEERPLQPWLMQITRNLARNRRRSAGRYWAAVQRWWQKAPVRESAPPPEQKEDARLLWQAVQQLRPSAQEIVYLRYFLQFSEAETAAALDIKPGTVKSRTSRALAQLRTVIEEQYPELVKNRDRDS